MISRHYVLAAGGTGGHMIPAHALDEVLMRRGHPAALVTDDREALLAAALAGAGIVRVGMFDPGLLASGALRRVLPDWSCPGGPALHALYRRTAEPVPRVAVFLDFFASALAEFDPEGLTLTPARR